MTARHWDLVLYGATGFTGRLAAHYLAARAPPGLRWAIAGRNRAKLEALQLATHAPGIEVADSSDPASVEALVSRTRVLQTTAGPFARYGGPVVDACVRHRVDYVDLTGETPWVAELIERHHAKAAAEGTRIVPSCGFDSVPSDLGTLLVSDWIREHWGQEVRRVSASFVVRGGGLNGGTLASMLDMSGEDQRRAAADVLLLNPPAHRSDAERARSADLDAVRFDADRGVWLAPFVMAPINTRVVRRSAALLDGYGEGWGSEFAYDEALEVSGRLAAGAVLLGMRVGDRVLRARIGRALARLLGPAPGKGPSREAMRRGSIRVRFVGEAADGRKALATIEASGDAGNLVTVTLLSEAALALAVDRDRLPGAPGRGGVLTPATALGRVLIERLPKSEFRFDVRPLS